MIRFAQIIFPLSLDLKFTYIIPERIDTQAEVGKRVIAPFGKKKISMGIIHSISTDTDHNPDRLKEIIDIIDQYPSFDHIQIQFMDWIADYYMSSLGDVLKAALPAGLNIVTKKYYEPVARENEESISNIDKQAIKVYNKTTPNIDPSDLNDLQKDIFQLISINKRISEEKIFKELGVKKVAKELEYLQTYDLIKPSYDIKDSYSPNIQRCILLNSLLDLEEVIDQLDKKPKQQDVLLKYLHLKRKSDTEEFICPVSSIVASNISKSSVETLIRKEIFIERHIEISRHDNTHIPIQDSNDLSPDQQKTLDNIVSQLEEKDVVLLQGITGSGKTEVYIKLIESLQEQEGQVLFMVPEIALTTQLVSRLSAIFRDKIAVYTSKYNSNERMEIWNMVRDDQKKIIVGTRSSIFLPFRDLNAIIIDEEHDSSYKQYDPSPRYNARDAAIYLARLHNAKVLLGSATPSLETYNNATYGKYGYTELRNRFSEIPLPILEPISTLNNISDSIFHDDTITEIKKEIDKGNQVIVFQNRRGYTPIIECNTCGWYPKCKNCDVSLTYHQSHNKMICHYCGYKIKILSKCAECGSTNLQNQGYGTERIQEELQRLMPETKISRMDHDTTRTKDSIKNIIKDIETNKTQILVGTQMVSKGFDFRDVTLVVIPDFDKLNNMPDFRAREKAYQIATQVMGRSGRRNTQGKMIVQTKRPGHKLITALRQHDIKEIYEEEMIERKEFYYPPYSRIIKITFKGVYFDKVKKASTQLFTQLRRINTIIVLGPEIPYISKIKNQYLINIWIKIPKNTAKLYTIKHDISSIIKDNNYAYLKDKIRINIDVDPD